MNNRYMFLPIYPEILLDTNSNNAVNCHTQLFSLKIVADWKHFVSGFSKTAGLKPVLLIVHKGEQNEETR